MEYGDMESCPICERPKYLPCSTCRSSTCSVPYHSRSFQRPAYYWPIRDRLESALQGSLSSQHVNYPWSGRVHDHNRNNVYYDIYDGDAWQSVMEGEKRMRQALARFGLGIFYDGFVPFKRKTYSMWAMFVYQKNFPPSIRARYGVGMFLVLLHDITKGDASQQILEPVVDDMVELFIGVSVDLSRIDARLRVELEEQLSERLRKYRYGREEVEEGKFILRAAIVDMTLDTKGWEHLMLRQGTGSLEGCPLCDCKAISLKFWRSRVILAARKFLDHGDPLKRRARETERNVPYMQFVEPDTSTSKPKLFTHKDYMAAGRELLRNPGADHIHGVKGVSAFARLSYWKADYVQLCALHMFGNIEKNIVSVFLGDRGASESVRKEEEKINRFQRLFEKLTEESSKKKKSKRKKSSTEEDEACEEEGGQKVKETKFQTPWTLTKEQRSMAIRRLRSICFPISYNEERLDDFLTHHKSQKTINRIRFLTSFAR